MPEIAVKPFLMQDAVLKIADDDFAAACSQIALVPSTSIVTFKGLKPTSRFSKATAATWVCTVTLAQDWETSASFARYLHDHEGEVKAAQILPQSTVPAVDPEDPNVVGVGFDVNLIIVPGQIGGTGDQVATSTVSLGVDGRPAYIEDES